MSKIELVQSAAYVLECECLEEPYPHAHIVCADGAMGPAVLSRTEAFMQVSLLVETNRIADDEAVVLTDLIYDSGLPSEVPDEVRLLDKITETLLDQLQPEDTMEFEKSDLEKVDEMFIDPRVVSKTIQ